MVKQGYKQTEIGVIPKDWEICSAQDLYLKARIGWQGLKKDEYLTDGKYYLVTGTDFSNNKINWENCQYVLRERYEQDKNIQLSVEDILITKDGSIGKTAFVDVLSKPATLNSGIFLVRPKTNKINRTYLYFVFKSEYFNKFLKDLTAGSTIVHLYQKDFVTFKYPLPSIIEQKSIAKAIMDVNGMLSSLEKLIAKKKAVKQGVMQELLTGKKRLSGFNGTWELKRLEEYCSLITKQTGFDYSAYIKPALTKRKTTDTLPMIQTINFRGKEFNFDTDYYIPRIVAESFPNIILRSKCVLFSIVGASVGNIGLYPGGVSFCGGAIGITRFIDEDDADWVYYYMNSLDGQNQIQYVTKGGAQSTVTIADIRNFSIPTPTKKERMVITSILSDMDSEIIALEQKLAKTRQIKQGMMQQLLTGKIRFV